MLRIKLQFKASPIFKNLKTIYFCLKKVNRFRCASRTRNRPKLSQTTLMTTGGSNIIQGAQLFCGIFREWGAEAIDRTFNNSTSKGNRIMTA